jgi:hypothetical protein
MRDHLDSRGVENANEQLLLAPLVNRLIAHRQTTDQQTSNCRPRLRQLKMSALRLNKSDANVNLQLVLLADMEHSRTIVLQHNRPVVSENAKMAKFANQFSVLDAKPPLILAYRLSKHAANENNKNVIEVQ